MSNPQSKSSQARKSAAKASQSSSTKSAHEVLENLIADNQARQDLIELLQEENNKLAYTIGSRDLEIHDLQEELADHKNCVKQLTSLAKEADRKVTIYKAEADRLIGAYNLLGVDYANLQTQNSNLVRQNAELSYGLKHAQQNADAKSMSLKEAETVEKQQRKIINNIKQMLSLQQQIMSDVGQLQ